MPNGKADRDHLVARRAGRRSSASWPACRSSGSVFACSTARSFSGCAPIDLGVGLQAVGEGDLDPLRAVHHVQVGEDDAVVDDHHAGADVALDLGLVLGILDFGDAAHVHHRGPDLLVGFGRREQRRGALRAAAAAPPAALGHSDQIDSTATRASAAAAGTRNFFQSTGCRGRGASACVETAGAGGRRRELLYTAARFFTLGTSFHGTSRIRRTAVTVRLVRWDCEEFPAAAAKVRPPLR